MVIISAAGLATDWEKPGDEGKDTDTTSQAGVKEAAAPSSKATVSQPSETRGDGRPEEDITVPKEVMGGPSLLQVC